MNWPSALVLLTLTALITTAVAGYAWVQRAVPGARAFALIMLAVAVMAGAYGLQLASRDPSSSAFWGNVEYLGIVTIPVGWLAFALAYTGRGQVLRRRTVALLLLVPTVTLLLAWTDDAHHLVRQGLRLEPVGSLLVPIVSHGLWFWINAAYAYLLLLAGTVLVVTFLLPGGHVARRQGGVVLVAALIPWVSNALYLARVLPLPYLDPTPFAFALSGLLVAWDLFALRLLDLVPLARDTVLAGMHDAVIVVDARGRVIELNPAAEGLLGRPTATVVGRPAVQVLPGWPAALTLPAGAQLSGAGPPGLPAPPSADPTRDGARPMEQPIALQASADEAGHPYTLPLGEAAVQRLYEVRVTNLRDRRGADRGRVGVVRDITERVRAEQERLTLLSVQEKQAAELLRRDAETAALRRVDALKNELLATVSHEFRTPLTVIHGYSQMLLKHLQEADPLDSARCTDDAQHILTASSQLGRLVEDLLDFERLGRGQVALRRVRFDLAQVLAEVLAEYRAQVGGEHLFGAWPTGLWVYADRTRIAQVLTNLVENALRYAAGTRIVLKARLATPKCSTDHPAVRVEVVDAGPGIRLDEQRRIWERFYRGRGVAELNVARGSGIGLAVVKQLVEAQDGRVGLESRPGFGSCFWFELPVDNGAAGHAGVP